MERGQHSLAREGIIAGILGAAVVALWFLILDLVIQGRPLFTPNLLGQLLLDRGSPVDLTGLKPGLIAGYTVLHFALFALFGIALTQLVHLAARYHIWRFALLIVVVVAMDFMSQVQSHLMSSQYAKLMEKSNLKGYGRNARVR